MDDLVKLVKDAAVVAERNKLDFRTLLWSVAAVNSRLKELFDFAQESGLDPETFILNWANVDIANVLAAGVVIGRGVSATAYANDKFTEYMVNNGHDRPTTHTVEQDGTSVADMKVLKAYVTNQKLGWTGTAEDVYIACAVIRPRHARSLSYWMHHNGDARCLRFGERDGINIFIRCDQTAWNEYHAKGDHPDHHEVDEEVDTRVFQ